MKEKKHIDRIFQEKLNNIDAAPKDAVWERINAELRDVDADTKAIPIWWKIAGIAAGLVLLIAVGYSVLNTNSDSSSIPTEVVDSESESNKTQDKGQESPESQEIERTNEIIDNKLIPDNQTATSSKDDTTIETTLPGTIDKDPSANENATQRDAVANSDPLNPTKKRENESSINTVNSSNLQSVETTIAETQPDAKNTTLDTSTKNATVDTSNRKNTLDTAHKNVAEDVVNEKVASGEKTAIANNEMPKDQSEQPVDTEHLISKDLIDVNNIPNADAKDGIAAVEDSKGLEGIKEEETINNNTDDTETTIEEALVASEDGEDYDEKEKEVINRWGVAINVSPVYYNSLGKGSSIHEQFNNNSKVGQLNMSYGVNASYAMSDKLTVRSGIGRVNVGYNTNDIVVYNSLGSAGPQPVAVANGAVLRNIDLKEEVEGITIISGETLAFAQVPSAVAESLKSTLNQEISFLEIPVELEYKVSDRKLDVSLIGGFSAMILESNKVYTQLNEARTLLGEANNINNLSYSANIGIGFGLKLSDRLNLNFEPNFKYQINTFNNATGDFKPYIIGVNSGLRFKF